MKTNINIIINNLLESKPLALSQYEFLERIVFDALKECMSNDETIGEQRLMKNKYIPDIFLPQGCKKLGLPPKTMIELKAKATSGLLGMAKKMSEDNPDAKKCIFLILDSENAGLCELNKRAVILNQNISFFTIADFANQYSEFVTALSKMANKTKLVYQWQNERERRVFKAKQDVQWHNISLFLGAGVSMSMKMPSWNELLKYLIEQPHHNPDMKNIRGTDIDSINEACGYSSIIAGRYVTLGLDDIEQSIRDAFYKNISPNISPLVDGICKTFNKDNVKSIITYNYDDIIENTLASMKIEHSTVAELDYSYSPYKPIYHVHGFIPRDKQYLSTAVLSEDRYHDIYREAFHWSNVEQLHALSRNVCFFIGLSMTDPNLRRLCDIAMRGKTNRADIFSNKNVPNITEPVHYAFLKRNPFKKGCDNCPDCPKNTEHFDIFEHMMNDLGIQVIWFTDYDNELPELVKKVFEV